MKDLDEFEVTCVGLLEGVTVVADAHVDRVCVDGNTDDGVPDNSLVGVVRAQDAIGDMIPVAEDFLEDVLVA